MEYKYLENSLEVLRTNINGFSASLVWLRRSYERCTDIGIKAAYADDEFDHFENLTSRYARTTDLLVNKVLRSIDVVEFVSGGTLIDVVNRAEQRGFVDSVSEIRGLKDLRNEIAHEYEITDLRDIFSAVLQAVPKLLAISEQVIAYCEKYKFQPTPSEP
ncbi:MAG: DUF86 domain-containing protein [Planctomycetaceae bacterium]|jgi:hypothetical protein|nr:DUF86 domain-containing protein [Planctomycetaceae bacterium]